MLRHLGGGSHRTTCLAAISVAGELILCTSRALYYLCEFYHHY